MIHFAGQFHPAVTHFPVALLLAAVAAEGLYLTTRRHQFQSVSDFCLITGTFGAFVAAVLGWALAHTTRTDPDLSSTLFLHRWLGTGTAAWAVATLVLWLIARESDSKNKRVAYRVCLFVGAGLVAITGHLGGILVYGLDYYSGL